VTGFSVYSTGPEVFTAIVPPVGALVTPKTYISHTATTTTTTEMPSKLHHAKPHPTEHVSKKTWEFDLVVPEDDGFAPEDSFVLELAMTKAPTGGTIAVKTSGPVEYTLKPVTITHSTMDIFTDPQVGLTLPYKSTATVEWKQGHGGELTDDLHLECKLVHLTFPKHHEDDGHLTGKTNLLGAKRKTASHRVKLGHE